jgi:NTP pyrophosphatase (non-canonical NTP hydrolase)
MISLSILARISEDRDKYFVGADGIPRCQDWVLGQWGNAMAGETGEACNVIKKIERGDFVLDPEVGKAKLAQELSDMICYAVRVATKAGITDLEKAIIDTFNNKSKEVGAPQRMAYYP